jgi:uncharacterized membrane protein YGL010W
MTTPFRPADTLLKQYAEYHRDTRNIATHLVGIPMIVLAVGAILSRPGVDWAGLTLTPGWVALALACAWYLTRGQFLLGLATSAFVGVLVALGHQLAGGTWAGWLGWGLGVFVVGWAVQFLGHYYEGRKPAFADDIVGLLVGPMFVTMELLGYLGLLASLRDDVERHAGPTHLRDLAHPVPH